MIIMMIFNMSTLYSHKKSFHYFEDYLMTKLTLGVRYPFSALGPKSVAVKLYPCFIFQP
jgi:hypothetical protein